MSYVPVERRMWDILKISKRGQEYISPTLQYLNLTQQLLSVDASALSLMVKICKTITTELTHLEDFNKLHALRGGFVPGADNLFYEYFPAWIIAQGEELLSYISSDGLGVIKKYVDYYKVPTEDLVYESLLYPFLNVEDLRVNNRPIEGYLAHTLVTSGAPVMINALYIDNIEPTNLIAYRLTYQIPRYSENGAITYWSLDLLASDLDGQQRGHLAKRTAGDILLKPQGDLFLSADEYATGLHSLSIQDRRMIDTIVRAVWWVKD